MQATVVMVTETETSPNNGHDSHENVKGNYDRQKSIAYGASLLAMATLCLAFSAGSKVVQTKRYYNVPGDAIRDEYNNWPVEFCTGVYCSGLCFVEGGVAIGAGYRKTLPIIRASLAMAIIAISGAVTDLLFMTKAVYNEFVTDYDLDWLEDLDEKHRKTTLALGFVQILASASALGLCIALCELAGRVLCGSDKNSEPPETERMVIAAHAP